MTIYQCLNVFILLDKHSSRNGWINKVGPKYHFSTPVRINVQNIYWKTASKIVVYTSVVFWSIQRVMNFHIMNMDTHSIL